MANRTPAERFSHLQKLQRLNKIFGSKRNYKPEDEEGIILKEKNKNLAKDNGLMCNTRMI